MIYENLRDDLDVLRADALDALAADLRMSVTELELLSTDSLIELAQTIQHLTDLAFDAGAKTVVDLSELSAEAERERYPLIQFNPVDELVEADAVALDAALHAIQSLAERLDEFEAALAKQGIFLGA